MSQHIGVTVTSEFGEFLNSNELNFAPVMDNLAKLNDYKNRYPWLVTIDPYGDTTVSALQREYFISELNKLNSETTDASIAETIEETIDMLNSLGVHQHLKFIGD